ncbi:hypothetical protein SBV1_480055 [Verrucomicrobia bacterium]|nr:hypothetical protein SBV1_480055 [Verrucomicrobiota bacterium]
MHPIVSGLLRHAGQTLAVGLCLAGPWAPRLFAFSSDGSLLTRSFSPTAVLTNSCILVTVNFTNQDTAALRGFCYSDQIPSGLSVTTIAVTSSGQAVTNYTVEAGTNSEVYADCTPYRWILEQPAGFFQFNSIAPGATVQIVYALSSATPGTFSLQQFSWMGFDPISTNEVFGYSETADEQELSFATQPACWLIGARASNGFLVQLNSSPAGNFALETSIDLSSWTPLTTNTSPFAFTDTNQALGGIRSYRARWLP